MDDKMIVELYWQRDTKALTETKQKYGKYCRLIAYNILRSDGDAEECENDTYLAAWEAIPPNRPDPLRPFLGKIARNISVKKLVHQNAEKRGGGEAALSLDELSECVSDGDGIEKTIEARELAELINSFLYSISSSERKMFVLRYWYCSSIAEISEMYGYGESRVKMTLKRTRGKLSTYLRKKGVAI